MYTPLVWVILPVSPSQTDSKQKQHFEAKTKTIPQRAVVRTCRGIAKHKEVCFSDRKIKWAANHAKPLCTERLSRVSPFPPPAAVLLGASRFSPTSVMYPQII